MRIIFSTTTARRLNLFERTLRSLGKHVSDLDKVSEVLHLDDSSSREDLDRMRELFTGVWPDTTVRCLAEFKFLNRAHHACMMQTWHDLVTPADYVFHCEDDWEFTAGGNLITDAVALMESHPHIGQVAFWRKALADRIIEHEGIRYWEWAHDPLAEFVHRSQDEDDVDPAWPHFSLRPSVIRCEALRRTGNFQQLRFFEHAFAKRWTDAGIVTVFLAEKYCFHQAPGGGQSVYEQLGTLR